MQIIAVTDSLDHPGMGQVVSAHRVASLTRHAGRWARARVVSTLSDDVALHREGGVALLVKGSKGTDADLVRLLSLAPDPMVLVVAHRPLGKGAMRAVERRGGRVIVPGDGGLARVEVREGRMTVLPLAGSPRVYGDDAVPHAESGAGSSGVEE